MKKVAKRVVLSLTAVLALSTVLAGCGKENEKQPQASSLTETPKQDLKEVKLKVYSITYANLFPDNQKVMDEVNKILKQKINATMDYTIDMSADAEKKIPLILASGEEYDGITVGANLFASEVAKGAFREIGDMLATYMPDRVKGATNYDLKDVTYNGKLYGMPGAFQTFLPQGWIIRGDLRKKYNIPEVKDVDSLKTYLQVLKDKEPSVIPFNTSAADVLTLNQAFIDGKGYVNPKVFGSNMLGLWYQYNADKVTVTYDYDLPEFKDFLKSTKEFADKGYWSKNAYSSKTISLDAFKAGTSFVATGHVVTSNDIAVQLNANHPDWEVEFARIPNNYRDKPSRGLGFVVPQAAKNPERLMMALELMRTDPEINALLEYGIKGVHYNLTSDGKVKPTDLGLKNYPPDQFPLSWGNRNGSLFKAVEGSVSNFLDLQKADKIKEYSKENKLPGFVMKKDAIASELAAMTEVINSYKTLIYLGAFDDVDAITKQYADKMKAAGADKVKVEVQKQIDAFLATKK